MAWTRLGLRLSPAIWREAAGDPSPAFVDRLGSAAAAAEAAGFDCLWLPAPAAVHLDPATLDPFVLAAGLAVRTEHIRLGCLDWPLSDRSPAMLAKAVASLDVISEGRAAGGVDAGAGEPAALAEALRVIRLMLAEDAPTFEGEHFTVRDAWNRPRRPEAPPVVLFVPAAATPPDAATLALVDGIVLDWHRRDAAPGTSLRIGLVPPAMVHIAAGWDALVVDVPAGVELGDLPAFAARWGSALGPAP
jgi:alkanesulfonate monooxygenase SsuD/methylene tetrahydromethanopterin reductase-like flavin-dependent oxidoreductase (luciferase family)